MHKISLSKKSLHWRFAHTYGSMDNWEADHTNICEYSQYVFKGVLIWIAILIACSLASFAVADWLGWLVAMISQSAIIPASTYAQIVMYMLFALLVLTVIFGGIIMYERVIEYLRRRAYAKMMKSDNTYHDKPRDPSFIILMYQKLKEKTCTIIEFSN